MKKEEKKVLLERIAQLREQHKMFMLMDKEDMANHLHEIVQLLLDLAEINVRNA